MLFFVISTRTDAYFFKHRLQTTYLKITLLEENRKFFSFFQNTMAELENYSTHVIVAC